jgi:hypothetical protein
MAQVQQRLLIAAMLALLTVPGAEARKFYEDDPLWQMPKPVPAGKPERRKVSDIYDYFFNTFGKPGQKSTIARPIPSGGVNTLGEVPDSAWYTNRHGRKRMSLDELVRGPGNTSPPSIEGPWQVIAAKTEGVTPGFTIRDSKGRRYQLKFDALDNYELVTGSDVMGSKFFWAFGYFTPQNYIVYFNPDQLRVPPGTKWVDKRGEEREMDQSDVDDIMRFVPRDKEGRLRGLASLYLEGEPVGPFAWNGVRRDDPNDVIPHENRRDLRGARIFYAWVSHTDAKGLNSLDTVVEDRGVRAIRHNLIDFGAAFGAEAFEPKSPRAGYVYMFDWPDSARSFLSLGLAVPAWARAKYKYVHEVGRLESQVFDPEEWKPNYYNPAFKNCSAEDAYWAAKTIMRFTEPEIRALVSTAQFSSKAGVDYLVRILVERQQKIGRTYLTQLLPLEEFRVTDGKLAFEDLAVKYGFAQPRSYTISWSNFDNEAERERAINGANSETVPQSNSRFLVARIQAGSDAPGVCRVCARARAAGEPSVTVYLRRNGGGYEVVGIQRDRGK